MTAFCAAVDSAGDLLYSDDPVDDAPTLTRVGIGAAGWISSISCTSSTFCVAVGGEGTVYYSDSPRVGTSWKSTNIDGRTAIWTVSCVGSNFCAAVDNEGNVLVGRTGVRQVEVEEHRWWQPDLADFVLAHRPVRSDRRGR